MCLGCFHCDITPVHRQGFGAKALPNGVRALCIRQVYHALSAGAIAELEEAAQLAAQQGDEALQQDAEVMVQELR